MTRIVALSSSFQDLGGFVAGSKRGSQRTMSSDNWALRLTPMSPHELQELCWQTATTTRLSTAGKSLELFIKRAISARLRDLRISDGKSAAADAGAGAAVRPISVPELKGASSYVS